LKAKQLKSFDKLFGIRLMIIWIFVLRGVKVRKNHTQESSLFVLSPSFIKQLLSKLEKKEKALMHGLIPLYPKH